MTPEHAHISVALTQAGAAPQSTCAARVPIPTNGSAIHPAAQPGAQEPLLILPRSPSPRPQPATGKSQGFYQHTALAPGSLHPGHRVARVSPWALASALLDPPA